MGFFMRHADRRRHELTARLIPRSAHRVLDAGAANGWLASIMTSRGHAVTGLDLGFDSIHRASEHLESQGLPIPFVQGDLYNLPFGDFSFDALVMTEVIEHLERPADALAEATRVLAPGGHVVITTPYRERIRYTLCIHCNRLTPINAHLHSFDESSLTTLFTGAGFEVERMTTFINRPAERLACTGLTAFLPHDCWRMLDSAFNTVVRRPGFIAVRGRLHD